MREVLKPVTCPDHGSFDLDDSPGGCPYCPPEPRPCEACEGRGLFYPVNVHEDTSRPWVERCDECEAFESDVDAARELVAQGKGVNIAHALPYGSMDEHVYLILKEA